MKFKEIFMYKYSVILAVSLMLFSGCGGGETSNSLNNNPNNDLLAVTNSANQSISRTLQERGYFGADNVTLIGNSTKYAFTYYKDGKKHFAIYDQQIHQVISDNLTNITGSVIVNTTNNSIIFDDHSTINVDNYKKPVIVSKPAEGEKYTKSPEQIIKERLGSRFQSFSYTKNHEGAFVYAQKDDYHYALYLYGLENPSNPIEEKILREYDFHYHFHGLVPLDGGRVELIEQDGSSPKFKVIYDYLHDKVIYNGLNDLSSNNGNTQTDTYGEEVGSVKAGDNQQISLYNSVYLEANDVRGLAGNLTYQWRDEYGNLLSTNQGFLYEGTSVGEHKLWLTVTDYNNNYAKDYVYVTVTDNSSTNSNNSVGSLTEQFKNDINNFEWYYVSHAVSPQGYGAVVLAHSDAGHSIIYLYGISENGTVQREKVLANTYGTITNLQIHNGGEFSYTYQGNNHRQSYL
jgi:hypothetical protein